MTVAKLAEYIELNCYAEFIDTFEYMRQHTGVDVANAVITRASGETLCMLAAKRGRYDILDYLVLAGAKYNHMSPYTGLTAIYIAMMHRQLKCVEYLVKIGADTTVINIDGNTLLHVAARNDNDQLVSMLLSFGLDANAVNKRGETAAHLAAAKNNVLILSKLMAFGAKFDIADEQGFTAVGYAAKLDCTEAMRFFIKHNIPIATPDSNGNTLLHIAAAAEAVQMIMLLNEYGVDLNKTNMLKQTPLHLAVVSGNYWVVRKLDQNLSGGHHRVQRNDALPVEGDHEASQRIEIDRCLRR